MSLFFLTLVLGLTLYVAVDSSPFLSKGKSPIAYYVASIAAGLFSALAYFCKGGLALPGLAVFAVALISQCGWRQSIGCVIVVICFFGVLVFPEYFYLSHRFPREFRYEQRQEIAHLFTNVEGWMEPWHYYITVYWRNLLGLPLAVLGFLAMIGCVLPSFLNRRNIMLGLWIVSWLVPLSFAVSKIANFLVPTVPAVILLVGLSSYDLLRSKKRILQYPMIWILLNVAVFYLLLAERVDQRSLYSMLHLTNRGGSSIVLLGVLLIILLASWLWSTVGAPPDSVRRLYSSHIAVAMVALIYLGIIVQNSEDNWTASKYLPRNYEEQMALRATAERTKGHLEVDAVVLVDEPSTGDHGNAHLYFQYWSGVDSLPAQQLAFAKRTLSHKHTLYILVRHSFGEGILIGKVPFGYLYRID